MELAETLTRKYGPLPGYAWAGIGGLGIAAVAHFSSKKTAPPAGNVTLTPATNGDLLGSGYDSGGGGGGGGFDLPPNPGTTDTGSTSDTGGRIITTMGTPDQPAVHVLSAPVGQEPLSPLSTNVQASPAVSVDPAAAAQTTTDNLGALAAGTASSDVQQAAAIVAAQPPIATLPVNAPVPGVESHPEAGPASAPALNTPPAGTNAYRPGFQIE